MIKNRILKIVVSLTLAVIMCLPATVSVFAASANLTITGPDSAKPGDTFTVSVNLNDNPGIAGYTLKVDFDTTKLVLSKVELGEKTASKNVVLNTDQGGSVSQFTDVVATYGATKNTTASGEYLKITFKVLSGASGNASIFSNSAQISSFRV